MSQELADTLVSAVVMTEAAGCVFLAFYFARWLWLNRKRRIRPVVVQACGHECFQCSMTDTIDAVFEYPDDNPLANESYLKLPESAP